MASYYLDTSALVKGYVLEPGSAWVRLLLADPTSLLFISQLTIVETSAAIAILRRTGRLSKRGAEAAYDEFKADVIHGLYHVILASEKITELAGSLAQIHPLKAYDAVQLATAKQASTELRIRDVLYLVSGDRPVLRAAEAEGLTTENPFDYAHLDK